jgi:hypothetical protein
MPRAPRARPVDRPLILPRSHRCRRPISTGRGVTRSIGVAEHCRIAISSLFSGLQFAEKFAFGWRSAGVPSPRGFRGVWWSASIAAIEPFFSVRAFSVCLRTKPRRTQRHKSWQIPVPAGVCVIAGMAFEKRNSVYLASRGAATECSPRRKPWVRSGN